VLGYWHGRVPGAEGLLAAQARDPHPRVRLEAVLAAGRVPSAGAAQAALGALDRPLDPLLDFALRRTTVLLRPHWYPEFRAGRATFGGSDKRLAFALQAVRAPDALPDLARLLRAGKIPAENRAEVLQLLAGLGEPGQQALAWEAARSPKLLTPPERARVLGALEQAARARKAKPGGELTALKGLFTDPDPAVAGAALRLAGAWKLDALRAELTRWAGGETGEPQRREAAVAALVDLGGAASLRDLERLAAPKRPFAVRLEAVIGLAALDAKRAAREAGELTRQATPAGEDLARLFTAFTRLKGGPEALTEALKARPPARDAARVGLRVLAGLGVQAPGLTATLRAAAGEAGRRRKLDAAERKRLIGLVRSQGDPARGEAVFRRPELACLGCHALGGAGGRVGPDLSGIGTSAQLDYLIESIVLPGKVVREGYATAHVTTTDGRAYSGVIVRESSAQLVLRDPARDEVAIPVKDIETKRVGGSLMPDGLDESLTDAELADLVRFLSELGRPGPFAVTHARVARSWQALASPPERLLALDDAALGKALREDPTLNWSALYSKVSGRLPVREARATAASEVVFARCHLEVTTPGKVRLALNDAGGLRLWVNGRPTDAGAAVTLDLPRGVHVLIFRVELRRRQNPDLRCELVDVPKSPAQANFVAGR
jgi:putative heme-binding domain-containing protein